MKALRWKWSRFVSNRDFTSKFIVETLTLAMTFMISPPVVGWCAEFASYSRQHVLHESVEMSLMTSGMTHHRLTQVSTSSSWFNGEVDVVTATQWTPNEKIFLASTIIPCWWVHWSPGMTAMRKRNHCVHMCLYLTDNAFGCLQTTQGLGYGFTAYSWWNASQILTVGSTGKLMKYFYSHFHTSFYRCYCSIIFLSHISLGWYWCLSLLFQPGREL